MSTAAAFKRMSHHLERRGGSSDDRPASPSDGGVAASFASLKTGLDGLILQTVLTASSAGSGSFLSSYLSYLANMVRFLLSPPLLKTKLPSKPQTNIQIMMGQISDASDFIRTYIIPPLSWRSYRTSLVLLQLSVLSSLFLLFIFPLLPFRQIFLLGGWGALLGGHPLILSFSRESAPLLKKKGKEWGVWVGKLVEEDAMAEDELGGEITMVEKFEVEGKLDGVWGGEVV
ncbi:hypothetical protein P7C70_g1888, partial [Phenoliferia sp. Uapishka_3]